MGFLKRLLGGEPDPADRRTGRPGTRIAGPEERSVRAGRPVAEGARQPQVVGHVQGITRASSGSQGRHGAGKAAPERQQQQPSLLAGGPAAEAALAAAAAMMQPHVQPSPPSDAHSAAVRASSLPQPLAQQGHGLQQQQLASAGSGTDAPVSPQPAAPPALCRASSTCPAGLSHLHSAASTHSSSAVDEAAPTAGASEDGTCSKEGSRRSQSGTTAAGEAPLAGWWSTAAAHQAGGSSHAAGGQPAGGAAASPPPTMRWHPAMGPLPSEQATPAWAQKAAAQQPAAPAAPVPTTTVVPPPSRAVMPVELPPGDEGSPTSPLSPEGPAPGSSVGTVSLLTFLLKGPSAASSMAASRESSVRSGIKRQPGALSLALSRENSIRGGARDASVRSDRKRSVRDGSHRSATQRDSSTRSLSLRSAGGRQEGSVLAQWGGGAFGGAAPRGAQQQQLGQAAGQAQQHAQLQAAAAGCGSVEWMGLAPGLAPLAPLAAPPALDPFAGPPAAQLFSDESDELELPPPVPGMPRHLMLAWCSRFDSTVSGLSSVPPPPPPPVCRPDPLVLNAALQALVASPSSGSNGSGAASALGPGSGPGCNVLVGDSELAVTGSSEMPAKARPAPHGGSPAAMLAAAAERRAAAAAEALAHSWDGAREAAPLQLLVPLGGSAPAQGFTTPPDASRGPAGLLQRYSSPQTAPGPDVTAATQEWNRSFLKRWREVKKRAYLQALGLRALWRVNSLSDRHEPLELLTNDLPQHDNGMRRAWSSTRLVAQQEEAHRRGATASQPAPLRRAGPSILHKDPSLSALLLGEVAEVC
ncbi:hypothetical protein ABPG75_006038 [Micractinium tetrahymenae]